MKTEGWEIRLNDYLLEKSQQVFKYGALDCVIFTAGAVQVSTGKDVLEGESYSSMKHGFEILKERGMDTVDIFDNYFQRRDNPRKGQRGDVAATKIGRLMAFGIVWGGKAWFKTGSSGIVPYRLRDMEIVWEVK